MKRGKHFVKVTRRNNVPDEHSEQVGFVNWFRGRFPNVLILAIPNGGFRSINLARRLVAEGVVAGVPDLFVPEWGLWIEMKRTVGGVISPVQRTITARLEACGYTVLLGKGATDASRQVLEWRRSHNPAA